MVASWKLLDFVPGDGLAAGCHQPAYDDSAWLSVDVPGDVHTALLRAGRIADPFYDQNEAACAWVEQREWWYRTSFVAPEPLQADERLRLVFHGLDTFATVWLNGKQLGSHANMFRPAEWDVGKDLRAGQPNTLAICFDRALDHARYDETMASWGPSPERIWLRKAQYGYGWDWGPRLPTVGIWRPVELRCERIAAISSVHFVTHEIDQTQGWALVAVRVEAERFAGTQPLTATVRLELPGAEAPCVEQLVSLIGGGAELAKTVFLLVDTPQLWWTHDLGTPTLYSLSVTLEHAGVVLETHTQRVGIRTIVLDQSPDPDEPGTRFFRFLLNGVSIFARGANWIPADSFVGAIPPARYTQLLQAARDAHMNMLRVWGGGIYEHDPFYTECDRLGLLVWQDFMFACAPYPDHDAAFSAEVTAEAIYQVRRLRSHPCMALWCGNNENQWLHDVRYWDRRDYPVPGTHLYHTVLPQIVARHDGHIPYWPSSPYGGDDYNSMDDGDRHNWDVWHGNRPFRRRFGEQQGRDFTPDGVDFHHYAADMGRFISEFGLHAAPVRATLEAVIPPEQRYHHSPALDHHNKDTPKNKGDNLMQNVTGLPRDLDEYIDWSMLAQAEGLKFAVEHYRRRTPHCSGTLIWQLNDCWPGLSWSVLDYYGVGKGGYYAVRRAYAPVLLSFKELSDGGVELWFTNDTRQPVVAPLLVRLQRFNGDVVWHQELTAQVAATSSVPLARWGAEALHATPDRVLRVTASDDTLFPNRQFFAPLKELPRPASAPQLHIEPIDSHTLRIVLCADHYTCFVALDAGHAATRWSDNYIELAPGEPQIIHATNPVAPLAPSSVSLRWFR